MENSTPAIVVVGYNRPNSLRRLLSSLSDAVYPEKNIPLIISLDAARDSESIAIAKKFDWSFGQKEIIEHKRHLGLKAHILRCGDLSEEYGSVIILEDDILVSPQFYQFAAKAKECYESDSKIAGISLYSYDFAESCFAPFAPIDDGSDVYFMQLTSSWGELFTAKQWSGFKAWLNEKNRKENAEILPEYIQKWGDNSWKKEHVKYLIKNNLYFVYPRNSYSTNFGDSGTNDDKKGLFQVNLVLLAKEVTFKKISGSMAVYDSSFELTSESFDTLIPNLNLTGCEIDLYGTKNPNRTKKRHTLTSQNVDAFLRSFGEEMWPMPLNIIHGISGNKFHLAETKDVLKKDDSLLNRFYRIESIRLSNSADLSNVIDAGTKVQKKDSGLHLPVISIVVVNYNLGDYLHQALNSIVSQGYPKLELIVIDGGSTDNSKDVISKFEDYISYWVSEPDDGQYHAIQKGFEKSTGEIMAWLNSDDKYHEKALFAIAEIFLEFPEISWVMGLPTEYNDEGITSARITLPWARWSKYRYYTYDFQFIQQESTFWRRELWVKSGAHVSNKYHVAGDMELWSRFFRHAKLYTALVLIGGFRYRADENQKSRKNAELYMREADSILREELTNLSSREKFKIFILKLLRFPLGVFFFLDIPYLRWFYEKWFEIPNTIQLNLKNDSSFYYGKWLVKHPPVYWRGKQLSIKK